MYSPQKKYSQYILGTKFDRQLVFSLNNDNHPLTDRLSLLERIVVGKRVVHLGCTDHLAIIDEKIRQDRWLHARLTRSAQECLGIDIDGDAIAYIRSKYGYENVIVGNMISDDIPKILEGDWDYLIAGEILEHIDDPIGFLTTLRRRYQKKILRIVVTVPNAFYIDNFKHAIRHREIINSDHRYWFTPYTLTKCMVLAGYSVEALYMCQYFPWVFQTMFSYPKRVILSKFPLFRSTLVLEATFS